MKKENKEKNYEMYIIKTKKFKTITISMHFRKKVKKEDIVYSSLLKKMLLSGTNNHKDITQYNKEKLNLYSPTINMETIIYGQDIDIILEGQYLNEKYTEKGMNEQTIKFILKTLTNPKIDNNSFEKETFEIIKKQYIEQLKTIKDNPSIYVNRILQDTMNTHNFKNFELENQIEFAQKINNKDLYNYYKNLFTQSSLSIFIIGDINNQIYNEIDKQINGKFQTNKPNQLIEFKSFKKTPKIIIKPYPSGQSNLAIGLKFEKLTEFERKYVSSIFIGILGGSWDSKLFQEVREKNSLCYHISARKDISTSSAYIYAGINAQDYEKTYELIKKQIQDMKKGNFTQKQIDQNIKIYHNSLISIEDDQKSILINYASEILSNNDSIEERHKQISKVTKQDIINIAKKIHYDVTILLKGETK